MLQYEHFVRCEIVRYPHIGTFSCISWTKLESKQWLSWKLLQALLQREGFDVKSPREALQKAYKLEWINDQPLWLNMLKDRNMISHTYHEDLAKEIYDRIGSYYHAMQTLYDVIKTTSD